jgi:hypothetical protein
MSPPGNGRARLASGLQDDLGSPTRSTPPQQSYDDVQPFQVMPPLTDDEYAALRADIAENERAQRRRVAEVLDGWGVMSAIPQPDEIARGPAGDCCILCGKVGIHLPLDHGCRPNIDVEAYRAQPKREVAL